MLAAVLVASVVWLMLTVALVADEVWLLRIVVALNAGGV